MAVMVQVRGSYVRTNGSAASGYVTFRCNTSRQNPTTNKIVPADTIKAVLDGDGETYANLLATDDSAFIPSGAGVWYIVTEHIDGAVRTYNIEVPASATVSGIDLADVSPVEAGPQAYTYTLLSRHEQLEARVDTIEANGGGGGVTQQYVDDSIATSSTADRNRANHTGTQTAATISDFSEAARDAIGAALLAGAGITITNDDVADTITIAASGGGSLDTEQVQDIVGAMLVDSASIDFTYNDASNNATAVVKPNSISTSMLSFDVATQAELDAASTADRNRANHTGTQNASTIVDFNSAARAQIEAAIVAGANVTITASGTGATRQITITSATPPVQVRRYVSGSWQVRGTASTDVTVLWLKPTSADPDPPIDATYFLAGTDILIKASA